jgi:predicted metalloprotease
MRLENEQQSSNVEDRRGRGRAGGGGFGGGLPFGAGGLGIGGLIIIGLLLFILPANVRESLIQQLTSATGGQQSDQAAKEPARGCPEGDASCAFVARVLGTTERIWTAKFQQGRFPDYGANRPAAYQAPTLVLFSDRVDTNEGGPGCGVASSNVGPFYCPATRKLYIDLSFYDVMARRLNAPGDFAQAYVIAHEVGHHIQNLIGATAVADRARGGQQQNQMSVRLELQADCFAGVWGHDANQGQLLSPGDLEEALNAAHQIGDDTLQTQSRGYAQPSTFTHGSSEQRTRWFRAGYDSGDPSKCDTFAVRDFSQL